MLQGLWGWNRAEVAAHMPRILVRNRSLVADRSLVAEILGIRLSFYLVQQCNEDFVLLTELSEYEVLVDNGHVDVMFGRTWACHLAFAERLSCPLHLFGRRLHAEKFYGLARP